MTICGFGKQISIAPTTVPVFVKRIRFPYDDILALGKQISVSITPTLALRVSQTTNFRCFQTQGDIDDNFNSDENGRKFSKWVENTVRKGEIAHEQFFLFFTMFWKDLYCRHVKTWAY